MIICHRHRYVFLHIPKTAGTSIETALGLRDGPTGGWLPGACEVVGRTKHHVLPKAIPRNYFVFTFVRDPWDRILSYYMFRREPRNEGRKNILQAEREMSFEDWLMNLDRFRRHWRINAAFNIAVAPQAETVGALPHLVGRFERLADDLAEVGRRIGVHPAPLRNVNPTTRKREPYAHYYTDAARELVADLYREDIERFGYRFQAVR